MLFLFWSFFFDEDPQAKLSTTPSDVKYPEVWKFLSELKLERYYEKLVEEAGCQTIDDILRLDGAILDKIGVVESFAWGSSSKKNDQKRNKIFFFIKVETYFPIQWKSCEVQEIETAFVVVVLHFKNK